MKRMFIVINLDWEGLHCWPHCPLEDVSFLQYPHRHLFHINMKLEVSREREIELILLKRSVLKQLDIWYKAEHWMGVHSCETLARRLLECFGATEVTVLEDGENGAICVDEKDSRDACEPVAP